MREGGSNARPGAARLARATVRLARFFRSGFGVLDYSPTKLLLSLRSTFDLARLHSCAKEPETVAWLTRHAREGVVLYDIGANVGAYTLIAASRGATVIAVEPSPETYASLAANTRANGLGERVLAFSVAVSDTAEPVSFAFSSDESGAAEHHEAKPGEGTRVPGITLDALAQSFSLPAPTMLKVDVDGGEFAVFRGAAATLRAPSLQTVLVEADTNREGTEALLASIEAAGFALTEKHAREKGKSTHLFNYIYERA